MSTVCWNARGLGGKRAFLLLQHLVAVLKPLVLFVSESKISCKLAYNWLNALNFHGVVGSEPQGSKGGLLLFWNKNVDVSLRSFSSNHVDVSVSWKNLFWRFTGCYAPPTLSERSTFWDLLIKLHSLRTDNNERWVIGGDFNEVLFCSEKSGGCSRSDSRIKNFSECCHLIGVNNLKTLGPWWTWTNGRKGKGRIKQRLDRFLVNKAWSDLFPKHTLPTADSSGLIIVQSCSK